MTAKPHRDIAAQTGGGRAEPLARHRLFETSDIDVARQVVAEKFCPHELMPGKGCRAVGVRHNHAAGENLSLNYLRYGAEVNINPGELTDFYLVQVPIRGTARVRNGRTQIQARRGTATILNPTLDTQMTWGRTCEKILLQIDRKALHATAERLVGRSLQHAVEFSTEVRLGAPGMLKWRGTLRAAVDVADNGHAFGANTHKHQALFEEQLITGLLLGQPSTISHMLSENTAAPPPGRVARARGFIHEHLGDTLTAAQIAAAAGCSIRSLQTGFQQHFGCSPNQYILRQRLNQAHYFLQHAGPETTVSAIAFDCGFSHLGRFSIAYRQRFGTPPRQTLMAGGS